MALFDFLSRNKIKNLADQAVYQYWISSGVTNIIPDDPSEYIDKGYSGNTSVYAIINRIDAMRKQARLKLTDKSGSEVTTHDLLKFLSKVNQTTLTSDFITQAIIYRLIIGEYFIYRPNLTAGLNKGKVSELIMLPSADVEIVEGTVFDPVRGYRISGNFNVEMSKDEVYHSKLFNPNWAEERNLHGLSPLRAAAKTLSKLNQIEITSQKSFENQGPPYILYKESGSDPMQNRMTDEQRDEVTRRFKNAAKENNRSLPLVLKEKFGKLDLGQNLTDMKIIESSDSGITALCSVYGLPPELMGYGQKTYNNLNTARKSAWTDCIMPLLSVIEDTFNECLIWNVPEHAGLQFKFDYSEIEELQEGLETRVGWMRGARWTGNEIRVSTGKQPIDDPAMDEPIIPMGEGFLSDFTQPIEQTVKSFEDYK